MIIFCVLAFYLCFCLDFFFFWYVEVLPCMCATLCAVMQTPPITERSPCVIVCSIVFYTYMERAFLAVAAKSTLISLLFAMCSAPSSCVAVLVCVWQSLYEIKRFCQVENLPACGLCCGAAVVCVGGEVHSLRVELRYVSAVACDTGNGQYQRCIHTRNRKLFLWHFVGNSSSKSVGFSFPKMRLFLYWNCIFFCYQKYNWILLFLARTDIFA